MDEEKYKQFIEYRNKILTRLAARNRNFPKESGKLTYYEIRLKELNEAFPEFAKFGYIRLKNQEDRTKLDDMYLVELEKFMRRIKR